MAVTGPGDTVTVRRTDTPGVRIQSSGHPDLPVDAARHTSGLAASGVLARAGDRERGVALEVHKGLPLAGGQGGSAASAVAAAVAVNALFWGNPLDNGALLECCLEAEAAVAGRHLDNLAPILLGGIVLVRSLDPIDCVRLPVPPGATGSAGPAGSAAATRKDGRYCPQTVSRETALHQAAQVAAMVAASSRRPDCSGGRSTIGSRSPPGRRCCQGSLRPSGPHSEPAHWGARSRAAVRLHSPSPRTRRTPGVAAAMGGPTKPKGSAS